MCVSLMEPLLMRLGDIIMHMFGNISKYKFIFIHKKATSSMRRQIKHSLLINQVLLFTVCAL